jgi:hypothetical protein
LDIKDGGFKVSKGLRIWNNLSASQIAEKGVILQVPI